jgi:hypothetical protein
MCEKNRKNCIKNKKKRGQFGDKETPPVSGCLPTALPISPKKDRTEAQNILSGPGYFI